MLRHSSLEAPRKRRDQLAAAKQVHRRLCRALRQTRRFGDAAQAGFDWPPAASGRSRVKMQIDEERCRLLVMAHQVAQEHIQDIFIHRNTASPTGHEDMLGYTFNRTSLFEVSAAFRSTLQPARQRISAS